MPRWKTQVRIEGDAIVEVKRLIRFGNSFALVLPKEWVEFHCSSVDGRHLVKVDINQGQITLTGYRPVGGER